MASPYNNGYVQDPVQRAPSPYNQGYTPDPNQSAPSPYTPSPYDQGQASSYYGQEPQTYDSNFTQNAQPQYNAAQPQYNGAPPAEGDRGILGAIGGGLTGGYVGKQTCHGFLGTVGGAIVGSLTEDWAKKKRPSRPTTPTHNPHCPPAGVYSPPHVDSTTVVSSQTHVQPGYWQSPPPSYQHPHPPKPCGHQHHCGCSFFGKH